MGFWSKVTDLHKKSKKLSLSHQVVRRVGGKKADAAYSGIGTAIGDAYTGGLVSTAKGIAYSKAAQEKAKKAEKKAAKLAAKQAKVALKQGLVLDDQAPNVTVWSGTKGPASGLKTSLGSGYVLGPKTDRNLALGSAGVELAQQFVDDGSTWGRGLDTLAGALEQFGAPLSGDDFGGGGGGMVAAPAEAPSISPWILVAGGVVVLLALRK